jgi:hypothetical protein
MPSIRIATATALLILAWIAGCDQQVDEGDDKLTEGNQSVAVVYYDSAETVHFDNLETLYMFNDSPVVRLTDVVLGSGLLISLDGLWFDFVGTDGYSPMDNQGCDEAFTPTSAELLEGGYLERGTRTIMWDESLEVPSCVAVKDVETIYAADAPEDLPGGSDSDSDSDADTDTEPGSGVVTVDYDGETEDVVLTDLDTADVGGTQVVLLTTIFDETSFAFDLGSVLLSVEGSDGYNPVDNGTCTDALPAAGELSDQAGIDPLTNDLEWDPALDFPSCAFVTDVAIVYVLDD